jgi:hypothetical protein
MKGYETEIANLKKEIEQLQETSQVSILVFFLFLYSQISLSLLYFSMNLN